jgi:hypothetical protein
MRARLGVLLLVLVVSGCSRDGRGLQALGQRPAATTTTTQARLEPSSPYLPVLGEVEPTLKEEAVLTVQALLSYEPATSSVDAARQRLVARAAPAEIADKAAPVLIAGASSAADVVYPQLGGLTADRASVMLVVRHRLLRQGEQQSLVRTVDVRLVRREARWTVEDIASFGGDPVPAPGDLSASARRVLGDPRIDLPDSARWDVLAGRVGEPILALLADVAQRHRVAVTVFASGHPHEVFGTTRVSNHTRGAAVDLWLVDTPVVAQRHPNGPLPALVSDLLGRGVTELGAPVDVDGPGGPNFTDTVHQDHLHLAIR